MRMTPLRVGGQRLLVLGVRLEDAVAHRVLGGRVDDGTQQREAAALAVHAVLPRRERDVPAAAAAALPDREADQLESGERAVGEVEFRVGELARQGCPCRSR